MRRKHLRASDVYKRQMKDWRTHNGMDMAGAADEIAPQLIKGDIDVALVPVSYTHLDVYKRQAMRGCAASTCKRTSGWRC